MQKPNLFKNGIPKYIHCYDNFGKSIDRYTVVFTGKYKKTICRTRGQEWVYLSMSDRPRQEFCQHGFSFHNRIDYPNYGHIGKKISFTDLPVDCQEIVIDDYKAIWDIN